MPETTSNITNSEEMRKFYRALSVAQANIINRLINAKNPEEMKKRATVITKKLVTIANEYGGGKCPNGQIRNPHTGLCEDLLVNE